MGVFQSQPRKEDHMNNMIKAILETRKRAIEPVNAMFETNKRAMESVNAMFETNKRAMESVNAIFETNGRLKTWWAW